MLFKPPLYSLNTLSGVTSERCPSSRFATNPHFKFAAVYLVSVHLLEKWRPFVTPKTLLWFRVRVTLDWI